MRIMTKRQLKEEIGQLREDMAAEFVKRDVKLDGLYERLEVLEMAVGQLLKGTPEADLFSGLEPAKKGRYEGLISVVSLSKRVGKRYAEITALARAKGLYLVTRKGHHYVRESDEIYYR